MPRALYDVRCEEAYSKRRPLLRDLERPTNKRLVGAHHREALQGPALLQGQTMPTTTAVRRTKACHCKPCHRGEAHHCLPPRGLLRLRLRGPARPTTTRPSEARPLKIGGVAGPVAQWIMLPTTDQKGGGSAPSQLWGLKTRQPYRVGAFDICCHLRELFSSVKTQPHYKDRFFCPPTPIT